MNLPSDLIRHRKMSSKDGDFLFDNGELVDPEFYNKKDNMNTKANEPLEENTEEGQKEREVNRSETFDSKDKESFTKVKKQLDEQKELLIEKIRKGKDCVAVINDGKSTESAILFAGNLSDMISLIRGIERIASEMKKDIVEKFNAGAASLDIPKLLKDLLK